MVGIALLLHDLPFTSSPLIAGSIDVKTSRPRFLTANWFEIEFSVAGNGSHSIEVVDAASDPVFGICMKTVSSSNGHHSLQIDDSGFSDSKRVLGLMLGFFIIS